MAYDANSALLLGVELVIAVTANPLVAGRNWTDQYTILIASFLIGLKHLPALEGGGFPGTYA